MRDVEAAYCAMEDELREELADYAALHPGFDEYRVFGEVSGHEPYTLAAMLSAMCGEYELADVREALARIFALQYDMTAEETTETRYRLNEYGRRAPYAHKICTVTLTCTPLEDVAERLLTPEQLELYNVYAETRGNCPDLFGEAGSFARMQAEAEKYLGFPYVWGGTFTLTDGCPNHNKEGRWTRKYGN